MKLNVPVFVIVFAATIIVGLAACGALDATNSGAVLTNSAQLTAAQGEYAAEAAYNAATTAYLQNEDSLTASQKATVKAIFAEILTCPPSAPCTGALALARSAQAAGDATTLSAQVTAVENLAGEIAAIIHPPAT
jgi:hypothetical protein